MSHLPWEIDCGAKVGVGGSGEVEFEFETEVLKIENQIAKSKVTIFAKLQVSGLAFLSFKIKF